MWKPSLIQMPSSEAKNKQEQTMLWGWGCNSGQSAGLATQALGFDPQKNDKKSAYESLASDLGPIQLVE